MAGGLRPARMMVAALALLAAFAAPARAASTETALTGRPNPSALGETVRLEALVKALGGGVPTGTVSFSDDGEGIGDAAVETIGVGQTIAAGSYHTCALTSAGGVKCWGRNTNGQLGDGTMTNGSTPVDVVGLSGGIAAIAAGVNHTCALTAAGGAKCWGRNDYGALGDGTMTSSSTPVDVSGLSSSVTTVAPGDSHTCALTAAGGVKCWGYNNTGQLGDGTTTASNTPVDVDGLSADVTAITAGAYHTCALMGPGGVKCWGRNAAGQLGDGTTTDSSTPNDVVGLSSSVVAIASGSNHTCALTAAGGVKCWGFNNQGQLGDGTSGTNRLTSVDVVGLSSGIAAITGGGNHTCVLTAAGEVRCWGYNYYGQLGDGTTTDSTVPVDVSDLSGGVAAIAGGAQHTCALTAAGGAKCWGYNGFGQVGDGTSGADRLTPVNVTDFGDGSTLQFGRAVLEADALPVGTRSLTAAYSGDAGHDASTSDTLEQEVVPAATATALGASANPSVFGQAVTLTATVTSDAGTPAGNVAFFQGATQIGSAALSGGQAALAVSSLAVGAHTLTAIYSGSASHTGSTSAPLSQTVNKGASATAVSLAPNPSLPGQAVTITATVTAIAPAGGVPAGTVTFLAGATPLGTAALNGAGSASLTTAVLAVGSHAITAAYGGNAGFDASTSAAAGQVVSPFASTTVVAGPGATALGEGAAFTATVTSPGGVPAGTVTFRDGASVLGTASLSGGTAGLTTAALPLGARSITAEYGGGATIAGSTSAAIVHTVGKAVTATSLAASPKAGKPGKPVRLTARVAAAVAANGTPGGQVMFLLGAKRLGTAPLVGGRAVLSTTALPIGDNAVSARYAGNAVFSGSTAGLTVAVDPRLGPEVRVNAVTSGHQRAASLARLSTGNLVAVWASAGQDGSGFGVYGQRLRANGQRLGAEFAANRTTAGDQRAPKVAALKGGAFVAVWESAGQDGSGLGVYGQRFDRAGRPAGPEFRVNTATAGNQRRPSVAGLSNGGFVVAWESAGQDGSGLGVHARRFGAAGRPQGAETRVNVSTAGDQAQPVVAALSSGGFAVAWASRHEAEHGFDVYARRFAPNGRAQGGEVLVNRTRARDQTEPAIAALGTGLVVAWTSAGQDGSGKGIYGQRLNQRGGRAGPEFRVHTVTARDQSAPALSPVGRGFVAAWTSAGQDGSGEGVYAQGFGPAGSRVDAAFRVNTTTAGRQSAAALAPLAQGRFAAAWTSAGQDGSGDGVFAQRFDIPTLATAKTDTPAPAGEGPQAARGE